MYVFTLLQIAPAFQRARSSQRNPSPASSIRRSRRISCNSGVGAVSPCRPVGIGETNFQCRVRHARPVTQHVDGFVQIRLRNRSQLGFSLCVYQQGFCIAIGNAVISIIVCFESFVCRYEVFDGFISGRAVL